MQGGRERASRPEKEFLLIREMLLHLQSLSVQDGGINYGNKRYNPIFGIRYIPVCLLGRASLRPLRLQLPECSEASG